jgi:DNA-binding NarL/FixJ family response regulator
VIRIAVVDNHEVVRDGIVSRLAAADDLEIVAVAPTVESLEPGMWGPGVVVVLDLWLDDGDSVPAIPALVGAGHHVLMFTTEERPVPLRRAVAAGACGLILKSDPVATVEEGVRAAAQGAFFCSGPLAHALLTGPGIAQLSERQVDILRGLADGLDYRGVAAALGCSEGTVRTHLGRIRERFVAIGLEPTNSLDLVRLATAQGDLTPRRGVGL